MQRCQDTNLNAFGERISSEGWRGGGGSGAGSSRRRGSAGRGTPSETAPKSSKFKGVSWHKHSQKWYAYIQAGGKMRGLGYYDDQEDAARAYDAEARKVCAAYFYHPFRVS